jgi:hypothetical protein
MKDLAFMDYVQIIITNKYKDITAYWFWMFFLVIIKIYQCGLYKTILICYNKNYSIVLDKTNGFLYLNIHKYSKLI